jgi:hypothetical protein
MQASAGVTLGNKRSDCSDVAMGRCGLQAGQQQWQCHHYGFRNEANARTCIAIKRPTEQRTRGEDANDACLTVLLQRTRK